MANYQFTQTGDEIQALLNKVETPDSTPTASSQGLVTSGGVKSALNEKVDKVSGKGLSTNDYTNTDKSKVAAALPKADVVDNLTTNDGAKALSAKQGKILKDGLDSTNTEVAALGHKVSGSEVVGMHSFIGGWNISASSYSKAGSTNRVGIDEFQLTAGDKILLTDYTKCRMYIGWKDSNNQHGAQGWLTQDFTASVTGTYVVTLEGIPAATIVDTSDLTKYFRVERAESQILLNAKNIDALISEVGEINGQTLTGGSCDFVGDFKTGESIAVKAVQSSSQFIVIYGFRSNGTYAVVISDLKSGCIYFLQIPEDFVKIRVYSGDTGKVATLWAGNDTISSVSNGERSIATANRARTTFAYNSASAGTYVDRRTLLKTGDVVRLRTPQNQSGQIGVYLLKRLNGNYVQTGALTAFYGNISEMESFDFEVPSDEYDYVRYYFPNNISSPFSFSIEVVPGESAEEEYSFSATNKTETATIFEPSVKISKGDCLLYSVAGRAVSQATIYFIKSGGNQNIYTGDPSSAPVTDVYSAPANADYTSVRLYINSATPPYDISFSFVVIPAMIVELIGKVDGLGAVTEDDLKMCLPKKVFAVKGLPFNIYKSSIMLNPNKNVAMFSYPYGTTNMGADLPKFGDVCLLENLKDTTLRVGLRDYLSMGTRLIHKDLPVVWNEVASPISKLVNIMGDSITNRGAGHFSALAASKIGCTITGFGTMTNANSFKGEGREGWTFGNFIGESNIDANSRTITPLGTGTSSTDTKNPFVRVADATDFANNPQWCFPSTGAAHETPYSEDSSAGTYYIFDYAYYLARWSNANIPDVVTIALGTNDFGKNYTDAEICSYARWMVSQITAAVNSVKIGIIPPGPFMAQEVARGVRGFGLAEALKTEFANDANVEIVGLWCFMSRYLAFGLGTNTAINASTDSAPYTGSVHFDGGDASDKRSYIEYGRVLASFILNQ